MQTDVIQKAILMNKKGQILLLRRSQTDIRRPGQWDLPGGMLDAGEALEAGLRREILEESGFDEIVDTSLVFTKTEKRTWQNEIGGEENRNAVYLFYVTRLVGKSTKVSLSSEHDDYTWVSPQAALDKMMYFLHRELLEHVINNQLLRA